MPGIEYFMGFDVFPLGWFASLYLTGFLFLFSYLGLRAIEAHPWEKAAELTAGTMLVALFVAFTSIPSFWSGIIIIIGFILVRAYLIKPKMHAQWVFVILLWALLFIFATVPAEYGYAFSAFALLFFYVISEFDIKAEKKIEEKEASEKKAGAAAASVKK